MQGVSVQGRKLKGFCFVLHREKNVETIDSSVVFIVIRLKCLLFAGSRI